MYNPYQECQKLVNKLQSICKERGISYYALAKNTKISTSAMYNIMNGTTIPQIFTVLIICNELHISIHDLFDEETEQKPLDVEAEGELIQRYRNMPPKRKSLMLLYSRMLEQYSERI